MYIIPSVDCCSQVAVGEKTGLPLAFLSSFSLQLLSRVFISGPYVESYFQSLSNPNVCGFSYAISLTIE